MEHFLCRCEHRVVYERRRRNRTYHKWQFDGSTRCCEEPNTDRFLAATELSKPFNPTTVIRYQVAKAGIVRLNVYDVLGREVATLVNDVKPAGSYTTSFNAANVPSGVYFYRLQSASFTDTKRLVVLK